MNEERLIAHFKKEEECDLDVHLVDKKRHIGWGRCLDTKGLSDEELERLGVEDEDDLETITQEEADYLFQNDIKDAIEDAIAVCTDYWNTLSAARQEVLVSMAFNAGRQGLRTFRKMHKAIIAKDFEEASLQMLDSHVAKHQAPNRYKRMAGVMRNNDEVHFELDKLYDAPKEAKPKYNQGQGDLHELQTIVRNMEKELKRVREIIG